MVFENANQDLILGDPNGAHIELLASEAKIVLYNEFNIPIMEFDGTAIFEGNSFSAIQIRNTQGQPKLQLDQFQVGLVSGFDLGQRIRIFPGETPEQPPALEIQPTPIAGVPLEDGAVFATSDAVNGGGALQLLSPTVVGRTPALAFLTAESDVAPERFTVVGDLRVTGEMFVPGQFAIKTAEPENRAVNTAIDPELIIAVPRAGIYTFTGFIGYQSTTTADFRMALDYTGVGSELRYTHTGPTLAGGLDSQMCFGGQVIPLMGSGSLLGFQISGVLRANAAGQLRVGWGQNTLDAAGTTRVLNRSWIQLERTGS